MTSNQEQDQEQQRQEQKPVKQPRFLTDRVLLAIEILAFLYLLFVLYTLWF